MSPDGDHRTIGRDRWQHDMHAFTAWHHTIGDRLLVIDPGASSHDESPSERDQLVTITEADVGLFDPTGAFDPDRGRTVDEDVGDRIVGEQGLEGAETEQRSFDAITLVVEVFLLDDAGKHTAQMRTSLGPLETRELVVFRDELQERIHGAHRRADAAERLCGASQNRCDDVIYGSCFL
jgi:hypothetical protein